jgi:hypothetical protein
MIELFHFDIETAANYNFKTFESNDENSKLFKDFNRLGWKPNMIV